MRKILNLRFITVSEECILEESNRKQGAAEDKALSGTRLTKF